MSPNSAINRRSERLKLLAQTSRDSEMGKLLRKFWHPVALSDDLAIGTAKLVRVLGEDLTLYRGESGRPYLVGGRCAHRLTLLHTGWVEGEQIRCIYHGWQYDGAGQCTQRPAERDTSTPNVKIAGYPIREYCGLIFAYLGEGQAPEFDLPRKEVFEKPGVLVYARVEVWPTNWFQQAENTMDAVHVSFVHRMGSVGTFGEAISAAIPELEYVETDSGIRQIATRSKSNVRISDWTFPNNNHINVPGLAPGDPWIDIGVWMVPVDDESTMRFQVFATPPSGAEAESRFTQYFREFGVYDAADHHDDLFQRRRYPEDVLVQLTSAQDYVAQVGQGAVADRTHEYLGRSDIGIAFMRKVFWREMEVIRTGGVTKQWRALDHAVDLPIPVTEVAD